jgi:hypothetical protein
MMLLIVLGCFVRNDGRQLFEHLGPAVFGTVESLFAEGLGDFKASVFEVEPCAVAVEFEAKTYGGVDKVRGRPRKRQAMGRIAFQPSDWAAPGT